MSTRFEIQCLCPWIPISLAAKERRKINKCSWRNVTDHPLAPESLYACFLQRRNSFCWAPQREQNFAVGIRSAKLILQKSELPAKRILPLELGQPGDRALSVEFFMPNIARASQQVCNCCHCPGYKWASSLCLHSRWWSRSSPNCSRKRTDSPETAEFLVKHWRSHLGMMMLNFVTKRQESDDLCSGLVCGKCILFSNVSGCITEIWKWNLLFWHFWKHCKMRPHVLLNVSFSTFLFQDKRVTLPHLPFALGLLHPAAHPHWGVVSRFRDVLRVRGRGPDLDPGCSLQGQQPHRSHRRQHFVRLQVELGHQAATRPEQRLQKLTITTWDSEKQTQKKTYFLSWCGMRELLE